jgi:oxygen-dependent protoporphyrinogen oxidase
LTDVVVVGGGIGGLVVARRLALGGLSVTLLEASDRLGGAVSHHVVGGLVLDAGAESFATRRGAVAALATDLGLGAELVAPTERGAWLQPVDRDTVPIPATTLLGIPGSPLAADVIAVLGFRAAFRAYLETVLPGPFGAKAESLGELVQKRMGKAVLEQLVTPIAGGVHSAPPFELEVDRVAPGLRSAMLSSGSLALAVRNLRTEAAGGAVLGIRGGVHRLVDEIAADLERFGVDVRFGARVTAVETDRAVVGGETVTGRVVVAAPGIVTESTGQRVVLATLVLDEPLLDEAPRGSGVLVAPGVSGIRARALTHATAKWDWLAERAEGKHVVRLSYDAAVDAAEALSDAAALLGVPLSGDRLLDFATVEWRRHRPGVHTETGIPVAGETAAGTGIANITTGAEALAAELLQDFAG